MNLFKFLTKNKQFIKSRASTNLMHGFDMDEVCLIFLEHCYRTRGNFNAAAPLNLLNIPITHHFIVVDNLTRQQNPFRDFITITYTIRELGNPINYQYTFEIDMFDFERRMQQHETI